VVVVHLATARSAGRGIVMEREFIVCNSDGSLAVFLRELERLVETGKRYRIRVKQWRRARSLQANAYYWSVVVPALADHCGYNEGQMHEELLGAYVGWEDRTVLGHTRAYPRRTTTTPETMDVVDFQGLIQTGQRIAAELGVVLPDQEAPE